MHEKEGREETNGLVLTVLGLGGAVEDIVKLLAVVAGEALGNRRSVGQVALHKLHDGVGKEGSVLCVEERGLREDLVDTADVRDNAALDKVLAEVAADEASTTEDQHGCHW